MTAAAFALARLRLWRWLAVAAVVLGALWTLPGVAYPNVTELGAHLFYVVAGFALAATLIVSGLLFGPSGDRGKIDETSSGALGAYLLAATLLVGCKCPRCAGPDDFHDPDCSHSIHCVARRFRVVGAAGCRIADAA